MGAWSAGSSISHGPVTVSATITAEPDYVAGGTLDITYSESGGTGYYGGLWYRSLPPGGPAGSWVMIRWQSMGGSPLTQPYSAVTMPPYWQVVLSVSDGSTNVESYYDPTALPPSGPPGSAGAILPALLGAEIADLPTTVVANTPPREAVNSWDTAADIADRSGIRLVDRGSGWEALPALPTPGTPVLTIEAGVNLISADSIVDIDQGDWAQSVLVVYTWPDEWDDNPEDATPAVPITRRQIAWSEPAYGDWTMIEARSDVIPATEDQAKTVADVLGARAWLRGHSLEVVTVCCAWVRVADTVTVDLPWAPATDYWVAEARHDSTAATSTLTLRGFTLDYYPAG